MAREIRISPKTFVRVILIEEIFKLLSSLTF